MDEPAIPIDETSSAPEMSLVATKPRKDEARAPWASAISMAEAGLLADVSIVFDLAWIYVPIIGTAFMPSSPRLSSFSICGAGHAFRFLRRAWPAS